MGQVKLRTKVSCVLTSALAVSLAACSSGSNSSQTTGTIPIVTNSFVTGSYVFSVTGTDPTDGDYSVLGSFVADGKGNITSGVADYNLGSGIDDNVQLTGTYTVSSTGTANVTLMDSGIVKDTFTSALQLTGPSAIQAFDGTGTGTLTPQVTAGFTPAGTYSVSISGEGDGTISGSGQFVAAANGTLSGGPLSFTDAQTALTYTPAVGFLAAPGTNGRGQAALEGNNLVYYVLGPSQIQMMGIDERALLTIPAQKQ